MKNHRFIGISDTLVVAANTLSILVLVLLVLTDFIRSSEGSFMSWIYVQGSGAGWSIGYGIEILPLIAVATIFLVTQIYLNLRLIQRVSTKKEGSKD